MYLQVNKYIILALNNNSMIANPCKLYGMYSVLFAILVILWYAFCRCHSNPFPAITVDSTYIFFLEHFLKVWYNLLSYYIIYECVASEKSLKSMKFLL